MSAPPRTRRRGAAACDAPLSNQTTAADQSHDHGQGISRGHDGASAPAGPHSLPALSPRTWAILAVPRPRGAPDAADAAHALDVALGTIPPEPALSPPPPVRSVIELQVGDDPPPACSRGATVRLRLDGQPPCGAVERLAGWARGAADVEIVGDDPAAVADAQRRLRVRWGCAR